MKLNEYIAQHTGEKVYIGADSGFFYMDTITEDTIPTLERIGDEYLLTYKRRFGHAVVRKAQLPQIIQNAKDRKDRLPGLIREAKAKRRYIHEQYDKIRRGKDKELIANIQAQENVVYKQIDKLIAEQKASQEKIDRLIREQAIIPKKIKRHMQKLKNFEPFIDREIKDMYHSLYDGTMIVLVTGDEHGRFWFETEYKHPELLNQYEEDEE